MFGHKFPRIALILSHISSVCSLSSFCFVFLTYFCYTFALDRDRFSFAQSKVDH